MEKKGKFIFTFLDLLTIFLSVYVLVVFAFEELYSNIPIEIRHLLIYIDEVICLVFIFDFFYRLYWAENKLKFLKWGWIDLISSIPAFPFLRWARVFRLIKLLRIIRSGRRLVSFVFKNRIIGALESAMTITILMVICCSIAILIVEKDPASTITTAFDAIYWSMGQLITGYTGLSPVTHEGKIIQLVLMFTGIALIGTFTAM